MGRKKRKSQKGKNKYTSQLVKKSRNERTKKPVEKNVKMRTTFNDSEENKNDL